MSNSKKIQLNETIRISEFILDIPVSFHLDQKLSWIQEFLLRLEEDTDQIDENYIPGSMSIELEIERLSANPYGEHLFINGSINVSYMSPCIKCLKLTSLIIESNFNAVYIPIFFENDDEYKDLDTISINNTECDLYFHEKGKLSLKDIILEQIAIGKNSFPLHSEDCKGLCFKCGHDLNIGNCAHVVNKKLH